MLPNSLTGGANGGFRSICLQTDNQEKAKNKKINQMTAKELDAAIEKTIKEQGNLNSRYGRELQKRKDAISAK